MNFKCKRAKLSDYQRWMIVVLYKECGVDTDKLRYHPKLLRSDGRPRPKAQIQLIIDRFEETGEVKDRKRTGRRRILKKRQEAKLTQCVLRNRKKFYHAILAKWIKKGYRSMTRRSLNNYALRNKISRSNE